MFAQGSFDPDEQIKQSCQCKFISNQGKKMHCICYKYYINLLIK